MNDFEPKRTYSLTAAEKRDAGKAYFYNDDSTCDERKYGLQLLLEAQRQGDPEAIYIVPCLVLREIVEARNAA